MRVQKKWQTETKTGKTGLTEAATSKKRRCMMCAEEFMSEWIGNRVCKKCQATSAWKQGA